MVYKSKCTNVNVCFGACVVERDVTHEQTADAEEKREKELSGME